jgi:hypothetical protein
MGRDSDESEWIDQQPTADAWDELLQVEIDVTDYARPRFARVTHRYRDTYNDMEADTLKYDVEHVERDLLLGSMDVLSCDVPDWLEDGTHLVAELDDSGGIDGLYYPYGTDYAEPELALYELDPSMPRWVAVPDGTYTVEAVGRIVRLWQWDDIDESSCPPTGAADPMTRQQPNDAPVPLYFVPRPIFSADLKPGQAYTVGENTSPADSYPFVFDEQLTERTDDVRTAKRRSYAEHAQDGETPPGAADDAIVVDYNPQATDDLTDCDYLVVYDTIDRRNAVVLAPLHIEHSDPDSLDPYRYVPETGDDHDLTPLFEVGTDPSAGFHLRRTSNNVLFRNVTDVDLLNRGDVFSVHHTEDVPVRQTQADDLLSIERDPGKYGLLSMLRDTPLYERLDLSSEDIGELVEDVQLTENLVNRIPHDLPTLAAFREHVRHLDETRPGERPEDLATAELRFEPGHSALIHHQMPEFDNEHPNGHPDRYVRSLPSTHQLRIERPADDCEPVETEFPFRINPVDPRDRGEEYQVFCERYRVPACSNVLAVRYEEPTDTVDSDRRYTRAWVDPPITAVQREVLEALADERRKWSDVVDELDLPSRATTLKLALRGRGYVQKHDDRTYSTTDAGSKQIRAGREKHENAPDWGEQGADRHEESEVPADIAEALAEYGQGGKGFHEAAYPYKFEDCPECGEQLDDDVFVKHGSIFATRYSCSNHDPTHYWVYSVPDDEWYFDGTE